MFYKSALMGFTVLGSAAALDVITIDPKASNLKNIQCGGSGTVTISVKEAEDGIPESGATINWDLYDVDNGDPVTDTPLASEVDIAFTGEYTKTFEFSCTDDCKLDLPGETPIDNEPSSPVQFKVIASFQVSGVNTDESETNVFFVECDTTPNAMDDPHFKTWSGKW